MKFSRIVNDPKRTTIRIPRAGKIRLGLKKVSMKTQKEYPVETDYFVCPPEVQKVYGQEPKVLPVMIPTEDESMVYRQYFASYGGNQKLLCQGDGDRAERRQFKKVGDQIVSAGIEEMECPSPERCDFAKEKGCKARMDLMVILPEISMGAAYQLSTGSTVADIDIRSGLEMARAMVGRISWIPFVLERTEQKIPDPKSGKMMPHWPVSLKPAFDLKGLAALRADTQRVVGWAQARYALPEPQIEGPEDDTPLEIVESMPGEDATQTAETAAPPVATPDIDPEASKQLRDSLLKDFDTVTDRKGLEVVASAVTRLAHTLLAVDVELLRSAYSRRKNELSPKSGGAR